MAPPERIPEALGGSRASSAPRGAPGGHSGELWGPPGGPFGGPPRPAGGCFLPLFATLSPRRPPRRFLQHRRDTRPCRYLRHLRHLAFSYATHGFPRAPDPVHICYTFCMSAPDATFPVEQRYAILRLFAALAAPGLLTRHSRIPAGTQSCAYLRHILHFRLGHRLPRILRPSNLMHICYTFPRRRLWDQFGDNCLGGFLPWSGFERCVVHTFPKICTGRLQRLSVTCGFARDSLFFKNKLY